MRQDLLLLNKKKREAFSKIQINYFAVLEPKRNANHFKLNIKFNPLFKKNIENVLYMFFFLKKSLKYKIFSKKNLFF